MKRVITAIALIALAIYLIFWAPHSLFLLAAACMGLICYYEYSGIVAAHGILRPWIFGVAAGLLLLFRQVETVLALSILVVLAMSAALRLADLRDALPQVSAAFFGAIYTFAPWRFAILLRERSVHWLFFALALSWAGDTAAYYAGRLFGKHPLAPSVSPKKTWEGALGSILGSVVFGIVYMRFFMPQVSLWLIAGFSVLGNIAGQLGDLAESAIKRGAGAKDSGHILPGHGGMLDRVDSNLFALPVIYLLLLLT